MSEYIRHSVYAEQLFNSPRKGYTSSTSSSYVIVATDEYVLYGRSASGTGTITIPSTEIAKPGRFLFIKDSGLNAKTYNVTINTGGAETIDGQSSYIIDTDGGAVLLYSNGSNLFVLAEFNTIATTTVSASTYTTVRGDFALLVTRTATGTCTITIPSAIIANKTDFDLNIKDAGFNASLYNITIETEGSELINNQSNLIINSDGSSVRLVTDGSNLFTI